MSNFPSDRHGQFIGYKTDHDPRQRATSVGPFTSKSMVEHLEERVRSRGTEIVGGVRVVDLIVDRSGEIPRCVGLLGLRVDALRRGVAGELLPVAGDLQEGGDLLVGLDHGDDALPPGGADGDQTAPLAHPVQHMRQIAQDASARRRERMPGRQRRAVDIQSL